MATFSNIIDSFGGPAAFAQAIGVTANHAGVMKARQSIPPQYWPQLVAAAEARDIAGVTFAALAEIAAARRGAAVAPAATAPLTSELPET